MITFDEYRSNLESLPLTFDGRDKKLDALERHHRILSCMMNFPVKGPTLDVASGFGVLYPNIKKCIPQLLPYSITDIEKHEVFFDGEKIECHKFECEKEKLELPDNSFNTVLFCDVIEHLIVDPIWVMLEINRVLNMGGHLVVTTPNACHIKRIFQILSGHNSATENHYKPTAIYQRHNREWTLTELFTLFNGCGFEALRYSTQDHLMNENERKLLDVCISSGLTQKEAGQFGPEIFFIAKKVEHKTLDTVTNVDERFPTWLYTHYPTYRKRPKVFPINLSDDYC